MSDMISRALRPIAGRLQMMIGRGVVSAADDAPQAQALQIELLADEVQDGVERFQGYGFTSHPHPGAEAVVVAVGGTRSHVIVVQVEDRRYRLKNLAPGEVALFDDLGQVIHLKRDGIAIASPLKVSIDAPEIAVTGDTVTVDADTVDVAAETVTIESGAVRLGGAGGQPVARVGDDVDLGTGKIISGSSQVTAE
jgi:phage baseplate assembly protein V